MREFGTNAARIYNEVLAYLHLALAHAGFWFALCVAREVWKEGVPKRFWHTLGRYALLAAIMGVVTAHSHLHLLAFMKF